MAMKKSALTAFIALLGSTATVAQECPTTSPGTVLMGQNDYIEYRVGNMPIVLSIPHGGYLTPTELPDRLCADCVTVTDAYTIELGTALADSLHALTGCYPHVIINHLDRIKLDANRNLANAALGNPGAEQAWYDFHGFIEQAKDCVEAQFETGLYVDLHGHGHTVQRIEYGYLLFEDELAFDESVLNSSTYINYSSLRNLVDVNVMGLQHTELLRGEFALGSLLHDQGYPGVPSLTDPFPQPGQPYFSGGYNTATHSSYNGGSVDGVQIECNQALRFDAAERDAFAGELAQGLVEFVELHYGHSASACAVGVDELSDSTKNLVWPNPGQGQFHISEQVYEKLERIAVFDAHGRMVQHLHQPNRSIQLTGTGVYTLLFQLNNGSTFVQRLINLP